MPKPAKAEVVIDMRRKMVLTILATVLWIVSVVIILAHLHQAGLLGEKLDGIMKAFFGAGVFIVPLYLSILGLWIFRHRQDGISYQIPSGASLVALAFFWMFSFPPIMNGGSFGTFLSTGLITSIGPVLAWAASGLVLGCGIWILEERIAPVVVKALAIFLEFVGTGIHYAFRFIMSLIGRQKEAEEFEDEIEEEYEEEEEDVDEEEETTEVRPISKKELQGINIKKPVVSEKTPVSDKRQEIYSTYIPPSLKLLSQTSGKRSVGDVKENAIIIKRTLEEFGIDVEMDEVSIGPSVTRYSMRPAQGLKLARISALRSELSLALAAHPIRIEAPIPGQSLVGIEIPNRTVSTIGLATILSDKQFTDSVKPLTIALGEGVSGKFHYTDLAKAPHMLIAGATGSGKSVTIHNVILSLLYRNGPEKVRIILVDPKRVELTLYNDIPHLLTPVIKDAKKAIMALRWAAKEMDRRYDVLESHKVRDIGSYHSTVVEPALKATQKIKNQDDIELPETMPYIVFIIDELADIMQAYPRELESGIVRLAQMSRAVGIHLVLSTQRPSVNVITGLIKANVPSRLSLKVSSQIDSRTILDGSGAETLLGKGDMLFKGGEMGRPERIQCANVGEDEVKAVVQSVIRQNRGELPDQIELGGTVHEDNAVAYGSFDGPMDDPEDDLFDEAKRIVIENKTASTSFIQRKLRVGYSRAARLIDLLEQQGIVGPANGSKPREILSGNSKGADVEEEVAVDDIETEDYDDPSNEERE